MMKDIYLLKIVFLLHLFWTAGCYEGIDVTEQGEFLALNFCGDPCETQIEQCCKCALIGIWEVDGCDGNPYLFQITNDPLRCEGVIVEDYCDSGESIYCTIICDDPQVLLLGPDGNFSFSIGNMLASPPLTGSLSCNGGGCITSGIQATKEL